MNYNLDIFINDNIDVEIDFSGHDLCVRLGNMSEEEFKHHKKVLSSTIKKLRKHDTSVYKDPDNIDPDGMMLDDEE